MVLEIEHHTFYAIIYSLGNLLID